MVKGYKLRKIFLYPGIAGCGISPGLYGPDALFFNNMRLEIEEIRLIGIENAL